MPINTGGSNWISGIEWDARGPYRVYLMDGPGYRAGEKTYIPPNEAAASDDPRLQAWAAQHQAPGGGFLRGRGQWDAREGEWDQPINFGNLASAGIGAAIGAPFLAGAFGGGAAAPAAAAGGAGGVLPSSSLPVTAAMTGPAAIASQGVSAGIPLGAMAPAAAGGVPLGGVAPAAGNGVTNWLRDHAGDLAAVGIPAAATALAGTGGGGDGDMPEELRRLLRMAETRTRRADPLHQAAVQMAFGGLPTYGRQGIALNNIPLPD